MLVAKVVASMTNTGLHFVEDEQDVALIAHAAQSFQVAIGGDHDPALALDGFDEHGTGVLRSWPVRPPRGHRTART